MEKFTPLAKFDTAAGSVGSDKFHLCPKFLTSGARSRQSRTSQGPNLTPNMSKPYLLLIHTYYVKIGKLILNK